MRPKQVRLNWVVWSIPLGVVFAITMTTSIPTVASEWDEKPESPALGVYPLSSPDAYFSHGKKQSGSRFGEDIRDPFVEGQVFLRLDGGVHYFNVPGDTKFAGFQGFTLGGRLSESSYLLGSFNINEFSEGVQFGGVLGWIKTPQFWDHGFRNRCGYGVLFGQYTDTRFSDLYLSQLRLNVDYALSAQWSVGVNYTNPLSRDQLTGGPLRRSVTTSERIGAHAKARVGPLWLRTGAGYRRESHSLILSALASVACNERVSLYSSVSYQDQGVWTSGLGVQYALGSKRGMHRDQYRGIELPTEVLKITNSPPETRAVHDLKNAERELFEEGVLATQQSALFRR